MCWGLGARAIIKYDVSEALCKRSSRIKLNNEISSASGTVHGRSSSCS